MSFLGRKINPRPNENFKTRLGRKSSLVEFYKAPSRYLKESNQIESAFEKPYLDIDYNKMHLDIPAPDWPTWNFDWKLGSGGGPMADEYTNCRGCGLSYWRVPFKDCEKYPLNIHASWWCSSHESRGLRWSEKGVGDIAVELISGNIKEITDGSFVNLFPDKDIWLDPTVSNHVILAQMTDIYGTPCFLVVEQECDVCTCPSGDFAYDDGSTPDTIAPGGSITLYVSGGCPPYSWSVSGLGYTLDNASTTDVTNGLNSASGTCGVNYGPIATVTVTDDCSDSVSFGIRSTGGSGWAIQCSFGACGCGALGVGYEDVIVDINGGCRARYGCCASACAGNCNNSYGGPCGNCPGHSVNCATSDCPVGFRTGLSYHYVQEWIC